MAGGLGSTISALIIDVLQGRLDLVLSDGEMQAIIVFSGLLVAYFIPEARANTLKPNLPNA